MEDKFYLLINKFRKRSSKFLNPEIPRNSTAFQELSNLYELNL